MSENTAAANKSKLELWLIILIPVVGLLIFTFMFFAGIGIPESTTNKGQLVVPARAIDTIKIVDTQGGEFIYNEHIHKWTLVIPAVGGCNAECESALYFTRQTHVALGKQTNGLRRFYLTDQDNIAAATKDLLANEYAKVTVLHTSSTQLNQLLGNVEGVDYKNGKTYFLVDPMGFVMMSYTDEHGLKEVLSDLKFLLKQSGES